MWTLGILESSNLNFSIIFKFYVDLLYMRINIIAKRQASTIFEKTKKRKYLSWKGLELFLHGKVKKSLETRYLCIEKIFRY